jgi:hypothetical protein
MNIQNLNRPPTIDEYISELVKNYTPILPGANRTFWAKGESFAMMRFPTFARMPPEQGEVLRTLWRGRVPVVTYLVDPNEGVPVNAYLYVCTDSGYNLAKLSKPARRDVRRANRMLEIGAVDYSTLLRSGLKPFCDTRTRLGFSDGVEKHFRRVLEFARTPGREVIGAWLGDALIAFMAIVCVDDWVEIQGSFSDNAHRALCPNDGLIHFILERFLAKGGCRTVSYGLSSVQANNDKDGLHVYKLKVGFEAIPVHRAFVFHPLVRPFVNRVTLWGANKALQINSRSRHLRKAAGVIKQVLNESPMV